VAGCTLFAKSTPMLAEGEQPKAAKYTKRDVSVVCIIGGPAAGKSTQMQNIVKRFGLTQVKASDDIPKQIEAAIASAPKGKKPRVILEGFPTTIEQSDRFERDVCPILVVLFIDLEAKQALARLEQRDKSIQNDARINWKRFEDKSRAIVKRFRDEGNILEITGEWPADEVWEQIEAKFESALELDDRGEL